MRSFAIDARDDGVRLSRYLQRVAPALPASLMYKYLREKKIKLDRKRCEAATRLSAGQVLELYISDEFFGEEQKHYDFMKASRKLTVVYEDSNMAVLFKPAGLLVHSDRDEYCDTLVGRFQRYLYEKGEYDPESAAFTPAACNRLDRGTQGLVLCAKSSSAARELDGMIKRRLIDKRYLCVCDGEPPRGRQYAWLEKNERSNTVKVTSERHGSAKEISTGFEVIAKHGGLCLVEAQLFTGRPHQIRAHLAYLGAPIVGDSKYGNPPLNKKYAEKSQLLCAYHLSFELDDEAKQGVLGYLDGKIISLGNVDFAKNILIMHRVSTRKNDKKLKAVFLKIATRNSLYLA